MQSGDTKTNGDNVTVDIAETLAQRGAAYGDFREQGRITQNLKRAMHDSPNWAALPSYMKEGLDMIQHKVSRILNGDALYDDNMHDIIGYTKLMQDRARQDRENGVVFITGGDKVYPVYEQEHNTLNSPEPGVLDHSGDVRDPSFLNDGIRGFLADKNRQPVANATVIVNSYVRLRHALNDAVHTGIDKVSVLTDDLDNLITEIERQGESK